MTGWIAWAKSLRIAPTFARAASEMQTKLISDWGAADGLLTELSKVRRENEASEHASAAKCASLGAAEGAAREAAALLSAQHEATNAELAATRSELDTARSELETRLFGRQVAAVHESLSVGRLDTPVVRMMLPFRMPRRK